MLLRGLNEFFIISCGHAGSPHHPLAQRAEKSANCLVRGRDTLRAIPMFLLEGLPTCLGWGRCEGSHGWFGAITAAKVELLGHRCCFSTKGDSVPQETSSHVKIFGIATTGQVLLASSG